MTTKSCMGVGRAKRTQVQRAKTARMSTRAPLQEHEGNNDDDEEDPEDPEAHVQNQDDMRGDAESGQIQSGKRRAESTNHDHDQQLLIR